MQTYYFHKRRFNSIKHIDNINFFSINCLFSGARNSSKRLVTLDDHTLRPTDTPGFKPFTIKLNWVRIKLVMTWDHIQLMTFQSSRLEKILKVRTCRCNRQLTKQKGWLQFEIIMSWEINCTLWKGKKIQGSAALSSVNLSMHAHS